MSEAAAVHTVRVEWVPYGELLARGRLGLVFEASASHSAQPESFGQLHDVERAHVLVSLLLPEERERHGALGLLGRARAVDLELIELPLQHGSVSPRGLVPVVSSILDALDQGLNVLLLARGALWRAGLALAASLVAWGHAPARALGSLRRLLGELASDMADHEALLAAFAREWQDGAAPARHRREDSVRAAYPPLLERFSGCLLGGAVGEALGGSDWGLWARERQPQPAAMGVPPLERHESVLTSGLALSLVNGTIRGVQRARHVDGAALEESVVHALARWVASPARVSPRAPGSTPLDAEAAFSAETLHALRRLCAHPRPWQLPEPTSDSSDAAALIFAAPLALGSRDRSSAFRAARNTARMTHRHAQAYLAAAYLASLIFDLVREVPLLEAMAGADRLLRNEPGGAPILGKLARTRSCSRPGEDAAAELGGPGEGDSGDEVLALALRWFAAAAPLGPDSALAALRGSRARGATARATARITGQLFGAALGLSWLPAEWLGALELRDVIRAVSEDLFAVAVADVELDYRRYPPE